MFKRVRIYSNNQISKQPANRLQCHILLRTLEEIWQSQQNNGEIDSEGNTSNGLDVEFKRVIVGGGEDESEVCGRTGWAYICHYIQPTENAY